MEPISILFAATFVEGLVTYLFGDYEFARPYLKYVALIFGIMFAIAYQINIPRMVGLSTDALWFNEIVSGIIIGRGSNYANDIISKFKKK